MRYENTKEFKKFVDTLFRDSKYEKAPFEVKRKIVTSLMKDDMRIARLDLALVRSLNLGTIRSVITGKYSDAKKNGHVGTFACRIHRRLLRKEY